MVDQYLPPKGPEVDWTSEEEIPILKPVETLEEKADIPVLKPVLEGQDFIVGKNGEILTY